GSGAQKPQAERLVVVARTDDDGQVGGGGSRSPVGVLAGAVEEAEIEQDEIDGAAGEVADGVGQAIGLDDFVITERVGGKRTGDPEAIGRAVFHEEKSVPRHCLRSWSPR